MRCGWASAEGRLYFGVMHGFHDLLFARLETMLNICMLTYKEMRLYKDSTLCQKE